MLSATHNMAWSTYYSDTLSGYTINADKFQNEWMQSLKTLSSTAT